MPNNLPPFPSLPSIAHFVFPVSPNEVSSFFTSLEQFTSALQVNSNARRGFQAFAVMKVMTDNYREVIYLLNYYICPWICLPITAVLSTNAFFSRGPNKCRAGLSRCRKAVFPPCILTFFHKFTGWPEASKSHLLFLSVLPVPEQGKFLSSVKHSQT